MKQETKQGDETPTSGWFDEERDEANLKYDAINPHQVYILCAKLSSDPPRPPPPIPVRLLPRSSNNERNWLEK